MTPKRFADFKNYVKATHTIKNNSTVCVSGVWANVDPDLFDDVTASDGALLQQSDRVHGLHSTANGKFSQVFETSDTDAGNQFNFRKFSYRVAAPLSSTQEIVPKTKIADTAVHVVEVIAVGRGSAAFGNGFKAHLIIAGNSGSTLLLSSGVDWNTSGTSPVFQTVNNGITVSNLDTAVVYDFYVTMHLR